MHEEEKHLLYNDFGIGQVLEVDTQNNIDASLVFKAVDFSEFALPALQKVRTALIDQYTESDTIS
ncbi:MAG: hypothetical protein ACNI3C_02395 [Candidatus Marinarcus sp.]|uniref:hypothetical protein n=1 Tax=Candidatus Marinarcus sp. TaxID=3100987 RepID=UPI003B00FFDA